MNAARWTALPYRVLLIAVFAAAPALCLAADPSTQTAPTTAPARADNAVTAGEFIVEPQTLICLGFEWTIAGDDNRNASVAVEYRQAGETQWKQALPLLRIGGEIVNHVAYTGLDHEYFTPHMFAGSILDLLPDTKYECRLTMTDPDGVTGQAVRTEVLRTRGEPQAAQGGRTLHVYPPVYHADGIPGGKVLDPKAKPGKSGELAYFGLNDAYDRANPGDVILVHAGLYQGVLKQYSEALGLTFHGTYVLNKKGTADKPIVIRAAGDGEAIFDGAGAYRLFDVMGGDYNYFEGLTIRNCDVAFYAGTQRVAGCSGLAIRNCKLEDIGVGVFTTYAGSRNFYIADNVFIGRAEPWLPTEKSDNRGWTSPVNSYYAVEVYGQGHVVCHNYVTRFHDGIDICTYGPPEEPQDLKCVAIDIYNNDIFAVNDDFIETDGGVHNIRVLRNRCFSSGTCGLSAQPVYGGPAYFIRNVVYHVVRGVAFKFEVRPAGLVAYHNTIAASWVDHRHLSNAHFRNNLFMGGVAYFNLTPYTTMDYDGFAVDKIEYGHPMAAEDLATERFRQASWKVVKSYDSLQAFSDATGMEKHRVRLDYGVFVNARPSSTEGNPLYAADSVDLQLKADSAAVDAGCVLPTVNDGFTGKAPDLGAYEVGLPPPHYGPRK